MLINSGNVVTNLSIPQKLKHPFELRSPLANTISKLQSFASLNFDLRSGPKRALAFSMALLTSASAEQPQLVTTSYRHALQETIPQANVFSEKAKLCGFVVA